MKHIIRYIPATLILFLLFIAGCSTPKNTRTQTGIELVFHLQRTGGNLMIAVFDNPGNFKMRKPVRTHKVPADRKQINWVVENLESPTFAVMCYQDLNGNAMLDREGYIPVEPWGMSNNPVLTAPPEWNQIAVNRNQTSNIHINVQ